jgi:hypothetical protein
MSTYKTQLASQRGTCAILMSIGKCDTMSSKIITIGKLAELRADKAYARCMMAMNELVVAHIRQLSENTGESGYEWSEAAERFLDAYVAMNAAMKHVYPLSSVPR